jgi:hypothetical protein
MQSYLVLTMFERELAQNLLRTGLELPESKTKELEERRHRRSPLGERSPSTLADLLSETYLGELLELSVSATQGSPQQDLFKELVEKCQRNSIFDIRNACAHPNRPFPPIFWYKVATLAHEPCVAQLNLKSLEQAVNAAEEGSLELPTQIQDSARDWLPIHNIADSFDHTSTGLLGRKKELGQLKKAIANPRHRSVALIGPPGVGKTAILLEAMYLAVRDAQTAVWADAIVYTTLKTSELSIGSGHQIDQSMAALDEVRRKLDRAVRATFATSGKEQAAVEELGSSRVLVCIDNLETLLISDPLALAKISDILPVRWRILASSQVPPDGAYGVEVRSLDDTNSRLLVREYARSRGLNQLPEDDINRLANVWDGNPLAIRLAVDAFNAGATVGAAVALSRGEFISSAYGAMLRLLSADAKDVLECLFAAEEQIPPSRAALILEIGVDRARAALVTLSRTSLVQRVGGEGEELYALADPIRQLLLTTPANEGVRTKIRSRLQSISKISEGVKEIAHDDDSTRWDFISASVPMETRIIATDAFRVSAAAGSGTDIRKDALYALELVEEHRKAAGDSALLTRCRAGLLRVLGDSTGADRCLLEAADSPSLDDATALSAAGTLNGHGRHQRVVDLLRPIYLREIDRRPLSEKVIRRITEPLSRALVGLNAFDEMLELTKDWKGIVSGRHLIAAIHIQALLHRCSAAENDKAFVRAQLADRIFPELDEAFKFDGYTFELTVAAKRAMRLTSTMLAGAAAKINFVLGICNFFATHVLQIIGASESDDASRAKVYLFLNQLVEFRYPTNPFRTEGWKHTLNDRATSAHLLRSGFVRTHVIRSWKGQGRSQLFAESSDRTLYFILGEKLRSIDGQTIPRRKTAWIEPKDIIYVLPDWSRGRVFDRQDGQPVREAVVFQSNSFRGMGSAAEGTHPSQAQ